MATKVVSIGQILEEMKEDLVYPKLEIGKLYWVLPKKCKTPVDVDTKNTKGEKYSRGFWIGKYRSVQTGSYYIRLLDFSSWIGQTLGANNALPKETNYPHEQPVMLLTLPKSKNGHEQHVDLLIGEKVYNNVIFEPLKMEWYFAPCQECFDSEVF